MKYILIALVIMLNPIVTSAQKHHLYTDIGLSLSQITPGFSATYNYRPVKWVGVGAGTQLFGFFPTLTNPHQYVPAIYGDLRFNIRPQKKNQFFVFVDMGINFYRHTNNYYQEDSVRYVVTKNNGTYTSFGIGYMSRLTERSGFYGSIKTLANGYTTEALDLVTKQQYTDSWSRGTLVLSFGFKF
jgi:hypothetical protein